MERWSESDLQEDGNQSDAGVSAGPEKRLSWTELLTQSYGLFRTHFLQFFRMAFLPFLLAYLFSHVWRIKVRPFLSGVLMRVVNPPPARTINFEDMGKEFDKIVHPPWYDYFLNARNALVFVEGTVYWFLSAFLFAAVATYVLAEETNQRPLADAYTRARDKIGPIFLVSLLGWVFYMVTRLAASFAVWRIIERFRLDAISATMLFALPTILICGLLSRLGLAIPWMIDRPADSFSSGLRNSVRKTENWEPFFMLFVIKSAIAGYAVYWLASRGLDWFWQRGLLSAALDPWVSRLVYISIAACLETPLFIAFSLLYRDSKLKREEALPAVVG